MTDSNPNGEHLRIPTSVRAFVYVVGMVGFPVLIASYVIMQLSSDMRSVDDRLRELTLQIDERPMSVERTTDFVIYITSALQSDLKNELIPFVKNYDYSFERGSQESIIRKMSSLKNELAAIIRPIVRKHQRFAARFPSIGGNIGTYFTLSAPVENESAGDTEAYLSGESQKDFSESLIIVIINLIHDYGHAEVSGITRNPMEQLMEQMGQLEFENLESFDSHIEDNRGEKVEKYDELINSDIMGRLVLAVVSSTTTGLRDQIIQKVRLNSSQTLD